MLTQKKITNTISIRNHRHFKISFRLLCHLTIYYLLDVSLYRYSKYLNDRGYPLSTKVLSNYIMKSAELLEPLYNALKANLVDDNTSNVIYTDRTPLKVIENMKEHRTNSYMFVYVSSFYQYPIYIYDFNYDRKTS